MFMLLLCDGMLTNKLLIYMLNFSETVVVLTADQTRSLWSLLVGCWWWWWWWWTCILDPMFLTATWL